MLTTLKVIRSLNSYTKAGCSKHLQGIWREYS